VVSVTAEDFLTVAAGERGGELFHHRKGSRKNKFTIKGVEALNR
jgi:hypothetical protein